MVSKSIDSNRKLLKKSDIVLIVTLLIFALAFYCLYTFLNRNQNELVAEILVDGQVVTQLNLDEEYIFSPESQPNVVFEIKGNAIAFQSSDCPDKVCVHSGYIKYSGQMAACLPNRIAIRIIGRNGTAPDAPDVVV